MLWPEIETRPEDMVVIVGAGEVGPLGSSRTRFELEVEDHLSPAGVIELAWTTGLIVWENEPVAGWHDVESGEPLSEGGRRREVRRAGREQRRHPQLPR